MWNLRYHATEEEITESSMSWFLNIKTSFSILEHIRVQDSVISSCQDYQWHMLVFTELRAGGQDRRESDFKIKKLVGETKRNLKFFP